MLNQGSRFNIPIPQPGLTPLATLLATLSTQTGLPLDQLKLIYKGAVLKDQSLTLTSYGIADGATLVLVGKGGEVVGGPPKAVPPGPKKKEQPDTSTESILVDWITNLVLGLLGPLQPSIVTFISHSDPKATNRPAQTPAFDALQREHARLSEMLLRGLLDLDGVEIPNGWAEARKERKEGVRRVQGELTKVDDAWGERKKLGA